jgi:hypothetical protein
VTWVRVGTLLVAVLAAVPPASSGTGANEPAELQGRPLGPSNVRLLVASDPPFVLDVDANSVERLRGIPRVKQGRGALWVVGIRGRGGAVVLQSSGDAEVYGVKGRRLRAVSLGAARHVWPAEGSALWVQRSLGGSRCSLRRMTLDGRLTRGPRAFPCASASDPAGGLGLVVRRTRVLDPTSGRTVFRARFGIFAVAGRHVLLRGPNRRFTLVDAVTGARKLFDWPSIVAGLDEPAVDPRGRYVALAFADPAWKSRGQQVLDVWLLDTRTSELTQLPGMPAFVGLKATNMTWTDEGRLVLLGESGRTLVAVWRPDEPRLAVKTVQLPERDPGSDSFAVLR